LTPRTGRPPSDNAKTLSTRIRLSDSDVEKLNYCSRTSGKTKADIIREGIDKVYQEIQRQQGG